MNRFNRLGKTNAPILSADPSFKIPLRMWFSSQNSISTSSYNFIIWYAFPSRHSPA